MTDDIWTTILEQLEAQMTQATFDTWLAGSTGEITGNKLTITVPTTQAKEWLKNRLLPTIQRTATRAASRPLQIKFTVAYPIAENRRPPAPGPGSGSPSFPEPETGSTNELDRDIPPDCQFSVELVSFDPTVKGFVMTANYAWQFWQPYLSLIPFNLWNTLRSFPASWARGKPYWPSIRTLAETCAKGNRHKIRGRAEYGKGQHRRRRVVGALEVLEYERIVWTKTYGTGRDTAYYFRVLDHLPLLTITQVKTLAPPLQERHAIALSACDLDYQEWEQMTLPTLTELMSRT